ncbi:N-acetyltransferase GCN5 [Escherichia coli]|uniref:N-acetyltransferase GCN5 n=1 Tax=Escherichia coli TaxID=562 RepID=A0A376TXL9_ECOLX|nr:N-acetyltransferase GCN5 [Escherichia coli]
MSEIVIRHAETRDYEAIRQIHAQPEVYCNTLQVPHPSDICGRSDSPIVPASSNSSPVLMETSWAISPLTCNSAHAAVMLPILYLCRLSLENRGVASALMREMIEMCDNWLRVDRIELTVFVDNAPAIRSIKNTALKLKGLVRSTHC